jgi:hypothetical protein
MKVPLKIDPEPGFTPEGHFTVHWLRSLPFFLASAGRLVHRVKAAKTHMRHGERSHDTTIYLCGGIGHRGEFLAEPPANRLVCEVCEFQARRKRLPTADDLAGRHCHVGRVKVEQTCCREEKERN